VTLKKIIDKAAPRNGIVKTVFSPRMATVIASRILCHFQKTFFLHTG